MRFIAAICLSFLPLGALAQGEPEVLDHVIDGHVLPLYSALAEESAALALSAEQNCAPNAPPLRRAYHAAFDAWIAVSHLRFGPAATDERIFALAFWPDSRGVTPRRLAQLITTQDPIIDSAGAFEDESVAARGFYALEFLLYDEATMELANSPYGCALIQRVSADIARISAAIEADWRLHEAPAMRAGDASPNEALLTFYRALTEGLQFTADLRLGRPMGQFDRPRPRRAETWRSGRSLRNVELSITSLGQLAATLAMRPGADGAAIEAAFAEAAARAGALEDPIFAGVAAPQGRFAVEVLQQRLRDALATVGAELAPVLGATLSFNSLDGD